MVKTFSTMQQLGLEALPFSLTEPLTGKTVSLTDIRKDNDNGVLVVFMCNHCPFVKMIAKQLTALGRDLAEKKIGMVGISANDIATHPDDAPEKMAEMAKSEWTTFPYLYDGTQMVAKEYRAACTPDFFLYDKDMRLTYRGQLDDARPGNGIDVTGKSVRDAVDMLLEGKQMSENDMKPSMGCNIKWIPGNEPEYAK